MCGRKIGSTNSVPHLFFIGHEQSVPKEKVVVLTSLMVVYYHSKSSFRGKHVFTTVTFVPLPQ